MFHWIWLLVIGLIAGALAKAIMPGEKMEPKGCLMTSLLGVAGSLLVGFIMRQFLGTSGGGGTIGTIIGATIGACILIWLGRAFSKK